MKICPNCHEEVEDNFDLCWNCNYSFSEKQVIEISEIIVDDNQREIYCLRCHSVKMKYAGNYRFHEGTNFGVLGNWLELFNNKESFDLYVCPECKKVELFLPEVEA
ncbi:MAG: hypothetical protein PHH37_14310 [Paludibacter sp.]|nr:hypothetical protein [Paludibacter sp.]